MPKGVTSDYFYHASYWQLEENRQHNQYQRHCQRQFCILVLHEKHQKRKFAALQRIPAYAEKSLLIIVNAVYSFKTQLQNINQTSALAPTVDRLRMSSPYHLVCVGIVFLVP